MSTNGVNPLDGREDYNMDEDFSSNSSDEKDYSDEELDKKELSFQSGDIEEKKDYGDLFVNVEGAERRKRAAQAAALKYAVTKKEATDRFTRDLKRTTEEREQLEAKRQAEATKQAAAMKEAQEQLAREEAKKAEEKAKAEKQAEQKRQDESRRIDEEMRRRNEKQAKEAAERKKISRKLARKQQKIDEREAKGRTSLFGGWRRYAFLAIIIIAGASITAVVLNNNNKVINKPQENNSSIKVTDYEVDDSGHISSGDYGGTVGGATLAQDFRDKVEEKLANDSNYKYKDAVKDFEETVSSSAPTVKIYMSIAYADFVKEKTDDINAAIEIMLKVENEKVDDNAKRAAYFKLYNLYNEKGDSANAKHYEDAVAALEPKPDNNIDHGDIYAIPAE